MNRAKRDAASLRQASDYIFHDLAMMNETVRELARGGREGLTRNALLDSFVIHVRSLLHFLYPPRTSGTTTCLLTTTSRRG